MKKRKIYQQLAAFPLVLLLVLTTIVKPAAYAKSSKSGTSVTKITVKTTGAMLNEGQVLTKGMLKKSLKVTATFKNGKTKKKYTAYNSKQIGKTIGPISKGKNKNTYKVVVSAGSAKKTVYVKVNRIKRIYFKNPNPKTLTEGAVFDAEAFKKDYTVYADYTKGAGKELITYTVSAPAVVRADANGKFDVTVKYDKNTATIAIPVTKPAAEEAATESSTTEDTSQEKPVPGQPTVGGGTTEETKPEQPAPEVPAVEEVDWLYYRRYSGTNHSLYCLDSERLEVWVMPSITLPDDYTGVQELGILYNNKIPNIEDNLLIGEYDCELKIIRSSGTVGQCAVSSVTSSPGIHYSFDNFSIEFPELWWNNQYIAKFRVFAVVKKGDDVELVFGPVLSVQLDPDAK